MLKVKKKKLEEIMTKLKKKKINYISVMGEKYLLNDVFKISLSFTLLLLISFAFYDIVGQLKNIQELIEVNNKDIEDIKKDLEKSLKENEYLKNELVKNVTNVTETNKKTNIFGYLLYFLPVIKYVALSKPFLIGVTGLGIGTCIFEVCNKLSFFGASSEYLPVWVTSLFNKPTDLLLKENGYIFKAGINLLDRDFIDLWIKLPSSNKFIPIMEYLIELSTSNSVDKSLTGLIPNNSQNNNSFLGTSLIKKLVNSSDLTAKPTGEVIFNEVENQLRKL